MRVAIIGSSGFVGCSLGSACASRGWSVTGFDATAPIAPGAAVRHVAWDGVRDAPPDLSGIDAVFHLAQSPHYRSFPQQGSDLFGVNVLSVVKTVEACAAAGVRWLFFASTGSVYRPSFEPLAEDAPVRRDDPYAVSKLAAEDVVSLVHAPRPGAGRLPTLIGRFFTVYGPGQRAKLVPSIAERVRTGQAVTLAKAEHERSTDGLRISIADVEDVAGSLCDLAERGVGGDALPRVLNIAPPTAASIRSMAEAAGEALGVAPRIEVDAAASRSGDLIADTRLFQTILPRTFRDERSGIRRMLAPQAEAIATT